MRPLTPDERDALQRDLAKARASPEAEWAKLRREVLDRHGVVPTRFGLRRRY